jgi:hypothetical protein
MHPVITIFCAFTRRWAIDGWLEGLHAIAHDPALTNLCFIVDADEPYIATRLKSFATEYGYKSIFVKVNDDHQPNEVRVAVRRQRIADIKNQSKALVAQTDGKYVLSFEDDTAFNGMVSFDRLLQPMIDDPKVAFVEGVQCGRWGVKMIGAWNVYGDEKYGIVHAETLIPDEGYQVISGGGWYGYATPKHLYINCDYWAGSSEPYGPDVNYGIWLYRLGYQCLIDWETVFGHRDYERVLMPDASVSKVVYDKDINTGDWLRTDTDKRL